MATGTLTPTPYQTVLDSSGNPISGAKIYTYTAGTTTAAATYTDVGLSVANANPIVADSSGQFVAYLAPGASYKYTYKTSAGVEIRTVDNISTVPAGATNLDITGTVGEAVTAGQAVYLSDGSGSKNAGQWYKADSAQAYSSTVPQIGMVVASIASGSSGTIRLSGQMTGLSVTPGLSYYVGTTGAITSTAPGQRRLLGVADSASTIILSPNPSVPLQAWVNDFRLTLTTGAPFTGATAATTIYCTPTTGNRIDLPDSSGVPVRVTSAEFSIAVPATTSQLYDVFVYNNAGVATLELLAWTNDTTRATAIVRTSGRYVKTGDFTRLYLGNVRTTTVSGQTEVSATKLYLWNYYNQRPMLLQRFETTASWTYSTSTVRQANGSTSNQVDLITGVAEFVLDLMLTTGAQAGGVQTASTGIGENSTTTYVAGQSTLINASGSCFTVRLNKIPAVGRNFYSWNEWSTATATTTWNGAVGSVGSTITSGLTGCIPG